MAEQIYRLITTDRAVRRGEVATAHGAFQTPAFMPVGTAGAVKGLTCAQLEEIGVEIVLSNTYHLFLRPGEAVIRNQGGLAQFTGWGKPTLTDSGGYQIFSLKDTLRVSDDGVEFRSHHDGSKHFFTPERAMQIQHDLGADIIMAFDQCVAYPSDQPTVAEGVRRTTAWGRRCLAEHARLRQARPDDRSHLFGIVQGGTCEALRTQSAEEMLALDLPGYAIGGLSVGESKEEMERILAHTIQYLPADRPRYLMGVGYPEDILMAVSYGVDMFDCVLPTRNARTGSVFTSVGPLTYRNAEWAQDDRPLDPNCDCAVCRRYSRAYLRHLYNQSEITGMTLATYHSVYFYIRLMREIREAIEGGRFESYRREFLGRYLAADGR